MSNIEGTSPLKNRIDGMPFLKKKRLRLVKKKSTG